MSSRHAGVAVFGAVLALNAGDRKQFFYALGIRTKIADVDLRNGRPLRP